MKKGRALHRPGKGYFTVSIDPAVADRFRDMSFEGDLVPWLVKLQLKRALMEALESHRHKFKGEIAVIFSGGLSTAKNGA